MYTDMKYDQKLSESSEIVVKFHQAWLVMKPLQSTRRVSFNCGYPWVGSLYLNFQNDQEWTSVATTPVHFSFWFWICANTRVEYKYINKFMLPEVREYFGDPDCSSASAQCPSSTIRSIMWVRLASYAGMTPIWHYFRASSSLLKVYLLMSNRV